MRTGAARKENLPDGRRLLRQREQELREYEARRDKLSTSSELLRREVEAARRLAKSGAVPEIKLLRLERQLIEAEGDLAVLAATIPKAGAAIEEARTETPGLLEAFNGHHMVESARGLIGTCCEVAPIWAIVTHQKKRHRRRNIQEETRRTLRRPLL